MKKYARILWIGLLIVALQVSSISGMFVSYAEDGGGNPGDITSKANFALIDLKENAGGGGIGSSLLDGQKLETDIRFGLFFRFEFDGEEAYEIQPGDFIKFSVPSQIDLGAHQTYPLIDEGDLLATAHYNASSKEIEIVFEEDSFDGYIPWGEFWFFGGFDDSQFGTDNPEIINFSAIGKSISVNVDRNTTPPVDPPDPNATPPSITKFGTRGTAWDEINWTITVNTHDTSVNNWVISDALPSTLEIVNTNAITVVETSSGNNIASDLLIDLSADDVLEIDFFGYADLIEGQYVITIPTKLSASALENYPTTSGADTFQVKNTALLYYNNETPIPSNEATVNVQIKLLEKEQIGSVSGIINHDGTISWKITVNKDEIPLTGVTITDIVDSDMEFVSGSVSITGAGPSATHSITDNQLLIDLSASTIEDEVTIIYNTKVNENYFKKNAEKTFNNEVTMTWDAGPSAGIKDGAGIGIKSSVIAKGGSYNSSTGHITWTITVNSNNMTLTSPIVKDVIPNTQRYVPGTFTIQKQGEASPTPVDDAVVYNGTNTLTYSFGSDISERYTITFDTLVLNADHRKTNSEKTYYNSATIESITLIDGEETTSASTLVVSEVLTKEHKGYNYNTREITWEITVNQNGILLEDAVITDQLVKGLAYVPGSLVVNGASVPDSSTNFSYVETSSDPTYAGTLTYTFPPSITTTQTIRFNTKVTDLNMFSDQNNGFSVSNTAILTLTDKDTGPSIEVTETESASQPIDNNIVSKRANYTPGNDYIEWIVDINSNAVNLNGLLGVGEFSLIDTLSPGLELDTSSVKLIKYGGVNSAGQPISPDDISDEFTKENIVYDASTNEFKFVFPAGLIDDHPFQLSFITDVVAPGTYSNSISLEGEQKIYNSNSGSTAVNWNVAGGGIGRAGKITVIKKDTGGNLLPGAIFELIDEYDNVVKTGTTDANGVVTFKAVALNKDFKVREAASPIGYVKGGKVTEVGRPGELTYVEENTIAVTLTSSDKDKSFEFTNEQVKAIVEFKKSFEGKAIDSTLPQATFGIFPRGLSDPSEMLKSAKNDTTNGEVRFEDIPHGNYDIREIDVPFGYMTPTSPVVTVEISSDEVTHGTVINKGTITNELIKTDLRFYKKDDSNKGLQNAEFTLFDLNGDPVITDTSDITGAVKSDSTGLVEFKGVLAGTYKILETKTPYGYVPEERYVQTLLGEEEIEVTEADHGTPIILADVTNVLIQASIEFEKQDDSHQPLAGASFGLYDADDDLIQSEVSQSDGKVTFTNLGQGTYTIKEVSAPTGYLPSAAELSVAITSTDNGKTKELAPVLNTRIRASVEFVKKNEDDRPLAGAEFGLYSRGAAANSTPIVTSTSNASGVVSFTNVEFGQYDIREITAPFGYLTLTDVVHEIEVTASDHGETLQLTEVSNELIRASIEFTKVDDSGDELAGAQFTLYNSDDEVVTTAISKADGTVEFLNVLAGTYTIRETKAPFGYIAFDGVIGPITIAEADHGTTISNLADVTNVLIQTNIEFVKYNEDNQPLAGATFGLYNSINAEVQKVTTGTDGKVTFTNIGEGEYTVKEVSSPTGYLLNTDVIEVEVTADDHNEPILLDPVVNTLIEANVKFVKLSNKTGRQKDELEGAVFGLYTKGTDTNPIYQATSDENGEVLFEKVLYGVYDLREIYVPEGYNLLPGIVGTVDINANNHGTIVTPVDNALIPITTVTNQIIKGHVEFKKVARNTDRGLKNARFAMYAEEDTALDNELYTAISDDNGLVRFENVEYGKYTIVEVSPPSGYYRSKDTLSVNVSEEGQTYQLGSFENRSIPNEIIEGAIKVTKVNTFGEPLAGAKFGVYNVADALVAQGVTSSSGIVRFAEIPEGVYTVKELEAPTNYVMSDQVENVTISNPSNYAELTFVNERSDDAPWPSVSVQKVDDAGKALAGVKFALYKDTDTTFAAPVANSLTDTNGIATFENIPPGKYVVKEIESLEGYILSNVTLPITVTEEAKIHNAGTVENRVIRGDIVVTKVNELNEPLQGAEFGLYDMNGKLVTVAVSNSDGIVSFKDIPYGSYRLKELAAPDSYKKTDAVTLIDITIDGKVLAYTIVNEKEDELPAGESGKPGTGSNKPSRSDSGKGNGTSTDSGSKPDFSNDDSAMPGTNGSTTDGKGSAADAAKPKSELPKTGDSITPMFWLFGGSALLIVALLLIGRRKAHKQ